MHYHCSADYWPSPGKVIQADSAELALREYREAYRVPDRIKVAVELVEELPNGGWRKAPPKE